MRFLILGFGKFGKLAIERIRARIPDAKAIVVDSTEQGSSPETRPGIEFIRMDAMEFLTRHPELSDDDVVVPMVPFNVAAGFFVAVNLGAEEIPLPPGIEADLPNPVLLKLACFSKHEARLSEPASSPVHVAVLSQRCPGIQTCVEPTQPSIGPRADRPEPMRSLDGAPTRPMHVDGSTLCCSRADFLCPDDCPEGDLCSVTGMPRDRPLFEVLEAIQVPGYVTLVQRSTQILPGLGGYSLEELRCLARHRRAGCYLVATSCKCHGIVTAVRV